MDQQLLLFDLPPLPKGRPDVFAVVRPDAAMAEHLARFTEQHCWRHGLKATGRPAEILHVTLRIFGCYAEMNSRELARIKQWCKTAALLSPAFDLGFDRVLPFSNGPLALVAGEGNAELHHLRWILMGAPERKPRFVPHLSLAYPSAGFLEEEIDPVSWSVNELLLIHSLVGKTEHRVLARWPLDAVA